MNYRTPHLQGIAVKKQYGQHFLREQSVVDHMISAVTLTPQTSVFEVGCGDGFLTRSILKTACARLWVFEIDPEWASYVKNQYKDPKLQIFVEDVLAVDWERFAEHAPWVLLANLPYQITFPFLHQLQAHRDVVQEAVVMVQEEVAQKLVKKSGRGYGYTSLFFQHYFELKLLTKIAPGAFVPPPKIFSRLVYLKPKFPAPIAEEELFWKFIKSCYSQPRRTLRNNLATTHYAATLGDDPIGKLRAQQLSMVDLLALWDKLRAGATATTR